MSLSIMFLERVLTFSQIYAIKLKEKRYFGTSEFICEQIVQESLNYVTC